MNQLEREIREITLSETTALATAREAEQAQQERLAQIRERIRMGETTGDRIRDLLILKGVTGTGSEIERKYREIEKRISGKAGQFVLLCERRESIHGCPGIYSPQHIDPMLYVLDTTLKIGVLGDNSLGIDLGNAQAYLPTSGHAVWYGGDQVTVEFGPIRGSALAHDWGFALDRRLARKGYSFKIEPELELEIVAGSADVADWLEKEGRVMIGYEAGRLLGARLPETESVTRYLKTRRAELIEKLEELWAKLERAKRDAQRAHNARASAEEQEAIRNRLEGFAKNIRGEFANARELDMMSDPIVAMLLFAHLES